MPHQTMIERDSHTLTAAPGSGLRPEVAAIAAPDEARAVITHPAPIPFGFQPFARWKDFARDFAAIVKNDEAADLFLVHYRAEQTEGALCTICGQRYVPDCNSGVCA